MTMYSFSVSETQHATLIGETSRRTRMLRRALIHKLTGQQYAEMPARSLLKMSVLELMTALKVNQQGGQLIVRSQQPTPLRQEALARRISNMYQGGYGPGSRSREYKQKGLPLSNEVYGYLCIPPERYVPDPNYAIFLKRGFEIAALASYTEAGRYLNRVNVPTPTGLAWSKDTARDFFRNTIYAGYVREYIHGKKRGPIALYPAWQVEALITLANWIAANDRYVHTQQIAFPNGFINTTDQEDWQRLVSRSLKGVSVERIKL